MEVSISKLIPHRKNTFFFDDLQGDTWIQLCDSIAERGVINPIIITEDNVIVSGHQRVRACKKLGIEKIPAIVRKYESEDDILRELIETNICQRGGGGLNPIQAGRCIKELERIYGIKNGGDRKSDSHNEKLITQDDIAEQFEISKAQLNRYKSLTDLIPELQDAVQSGQITATTAMGFVKRLSPDEQKQLAEQLVGQEKVPSRKVQEYIDTIKEKDAENEKLRLALSESETKRISAERQKEVIREVEIEVEPADYKDLKAKAKKSDAWKKDFEREQMKVVEKNNEILALNDRIKELQEQTAQSTSTAKLIEGSIYFVAQCGSFIRDMGGYVWIADKIAELPERERTDFMKALKAVEDWSEIMMQNIERGMKG